jgi:hypothetical protein
MKLTIAKLSKKAAIATGLKYVCRASSEYKSTIFLLKHLSPLILQLSDYASGFNWGAIEDALQAEGVWEGELSMPQGRGDLVVGELNGKFITSQY